MAERLVVVTGGGKGIGRAVVERFSELGDRVVATGRDEGALKAVADATGASYEVLDVADEEAVADVFGRLGPVDVLVNNAGVSRSAAVHRTTLEDWDWHMRVNATGAFLCTRAVLPSMRERDSGRIVTVASTTAHMGFPYIAAYAASKHAVVGFMRVVAAEVAGTGVTANSVCPSYVRSDMTDRSIANIIDKTGRTAEEAEQSLAKMSPLGRLIEAEEVAAAVAFLASADAAPINGQSIVIDGGGIQR